MTPDFLTILEAVEGKRCAKRYASLEEKPDPYDAGFLFRVAEVPVASLAELAEVLEGLRIDPRCMLIRDRLKPSAEPSPNGLYARRRVDRPGDPAPFEHAPHHWAMFDADKTAQAFDPDDPQGSVEAWRDALPGPLATAAMVFQFSASQHLSPTVRGHAFVWLAEPAGNVELARWSIRNGLDPAMFHAVQPHYTADPLFAEGLADPLGERELICLDGSEAVDLGFTEADLDEAALPGQGGQRLGSIALEEVGDPSDDEQAEHARGVIAGQLARAFEGPGKRWDLCGHIGGACANANVPPEECCAILEALRAGDVPDHEFASGLRWALGAYRFSARPLGIKGIAALTSPVTAVKIGAALSSLAKALAPVEATPKPEQPKAKTFGGLPFDAFDHDADPEPIPYIIPALNIGPGKPTAIVGYAYSSKTPWGLELAIAVASGATHFQGHEIAYSTRVLYIATEGARNARRKAARIAKAWGTSLAEIGARLVIVQAPPGFLNVETAEQIGEQAEAGAFGLVLIDTYNSAFDGSKDRNSNEFSLALKVLGDISDRQATTFCALLHCRKATVATKGRAPTLQEIDGHNSIAGAVQAAIGLWRPAPTDKHLIAVECVRAVDDSFDSYCIRWTDTPGQGELGLRSEIEEAPAVANEAAEKRAAAAEAEAKAKDQLLKLLATGESWTWSEINTKAGLNIGRNDPTKRLLAAMVAAGEIVESAGKEIGGGRKGLRYTLAPRSPKTAEAAAKRVGFLGKPKG